MGTGEQNMNKGNIKVKGNRDKGYIHLWEGTEYYGNKGTGTVTKGTHDIIGTGEQEQQGHT